MTDKLTPHMLGLLRLVSAQPAGRLGVSDAPDDPVAPWCDDKEPTDTFNEAINAGLLQFSLDSDTDNASVKITEAGRRALSTDGGGER